MAYRALAEFVVVLHLGFVLFAIGGGLLVLRWRRLAWLHLPAVVWAAAIEFFGWICPLTPIENRLRRAGGEAGYESGFVEQYLTKFLYPAELTRQSQWILGLLVLAVNLAIYAVIWRRPRRTVSSWPGRVRKRR